MSKLVGVWDLTESENWDEYLKALGIHYKLNHLNKIKS